MNEDFLQKMSLLEAIDKRLKLHGKVLPTYVYELRVLYLGTYHDQFEFWLDEENPIQRLSSYEEARWLVVDESIIISQADYHLFKTGLKL